ncbi:MAG: hypothetical protein AAGA97_01255 [Pseudomonadota bacterium]
MGQDIEFTTSGLPEGAAKRTIEPPGPDPALYAEYLEDFDFTDEQAREFLEAIFYIMKSFVEIGFGVDSLQFIVPGSGEMDEDAGQEDDQ